MTTAIHHTVVKSAARHGARFAETADGQFRLVRLDDETQRSTNAWDSVGEALDALKAGEVEFATPRVPNGRCGVMPASHHARYTANPHGPGCNDTLDCSMRDAFMTQGEGDKEPWLDTDALRECGEAIGLWNPNWERLNPGMQRMNLANRLRGFLRNNAEAQVTIGTATGRFGIEAKPKPERKSRAKKAAAD